MENNGEFIYALYFEVDSEKFYFYVGRSGRGENRVPGVRFKEHLAHSKYDTTPVYVFMREELADLNLPCYEEILCWVDADEATTNDTEFYWVVKLIRDGHELKNAKNGDAKKFAEAKGAALSVFEINSPADVTTYKSFIAKQQKLDKSQKLRASILEKESAKNAVFEGHSNKNELLASLNKTSSVVEKKAMTIYSERAQEAFDCGKYNLALTYLGKSYTKFAEQFGITYNECVS